MKQKPTLDDLISLIRTHQCISEQITINGSTLLEKDLGITGDDGSELLEEIENKYDISFSGENGTIQGAFELEEDEYLFHSEGEGLDIIGSVLSCFGKSTEK